MQKVFFFLFFPFSFLMPSILFSHALLANTNYPGLLSEQVEAPFCYMETADGRILNLANLCRQEPENVNTCTSGAAGMPVTNVRYDGNSLSGQVTNQTCNTVQLIKVNYQVLDEQGNEIDNGFIYAQPSTIVQGKTATFRGTIAPGSEVNITHVEWSDG